MFFKKKKNEKGRHDLPVAEVQQMTRKGMNDKDIIKKLKSKGYSYDEIESAMLQAVKSSVVDEPMVRRAEPELPEFESFYSQPEEPQSFETLPDIGSEMPEDIEEPNIMLEELVEGVIEEKWQKFTDNVKKMESDIDKVHAEIKQFEQKMEFVKRESPTKELESKLIDISEQYDDLDARIGGLEKAFKQFLPSLTRNIESLSKMIHEMKSKQSTIEENRF